MADKEKTYTIYVSHGPDDTKKVEKTKDELTKEDIDFFTGKLIFTFNNSPSESQQKFIAKLLETINLKS
jgi:hypothetical protein